MATQPLDPSSKNLSIYTYRIARYESLMSSCVFLQKKQPDESWLVEERRIFTNFGPSLVRNIFSGFASNKTVTNLVVKHWPENSQSRKLDCFSRGILTQFSTVRRYVGRHRMCCVDNLLGSSYWPEDDEFDAEAGAVRCSMVDVPKLAQLVAVLAKIEDMR